MISQLLERGRPLILLDARDAQCHQRLGASIVYAHDQCHSHIRAGGATPAILAIAAPMFANI